MTPRPALSILAHLRFLGFLSLSLLCCCSGPSPRSRVVVSVGDQRLGVYDRNGVLEKTYNISTSKFGLGDALNSYRTPLGRHEVIAKIGHGLPSGAVLKSRRWNGEVLRPDAPGRDPIVSRILWLDGQERGNRNAKRRYIYIHGTTEERNLGKPVSYGCIRMGMRDVVELFNSLRIGDDVYVTKRGLPKGEIHPPPAQMPAARPQVAGQRSPSRQTVRTRAARG